MIPYGTPDGFAAYHEARGNSFAEIYTDDDQIAAALLVASEFIDARYGASFSGIKVGQRDQVREWPRSGAVDKDGYAVGIDVPFEVTNATYEAALKQLINPGAFTVDYKPSKYKRASVDGAVSVEYAAYGSASEAQTKFPIIDQILMNLLTRNGADFSPLSGATVRV